MAETIRLLMGMNTATMAIMRTTITLMNEGCDWLPNLMTWLSPSYPVGAYSYSHGLESAVELGAVRTAADLVEYVGVVLEFGAGWSDLVLAAAAWRAMKDGRRGELDHLAELGLALRPTSEFALESLQQGTSFASTTGAAWPNAAFDLFVEAHPGEIVYPIAVGAASARCAPLQAALLALGHAIASNLVSAGLRLIPLGQTDGQRAISMLAPKIAVIVERAEQAELADIGTAAPAIEVLSMRHETQYTRLFRS